MKFNAAKCHSARILRADGAGSGCEQYYAGMPYSGETVQSADWRGKVIVIGRTSFWVGTGGQVSLDRRLEILWVPVEELADE